MLRKSDTRKDVSFLTVYYMMIKKGTSVVDKFMTILKFDTFSLYQDFKTKTTKEWHNLDDKTRKKIVTNMGNAKTELLKLIRFSGEEIDTIKSLLFEKKTSPLLIGRIGQTLSVHF